MIDKFALIIGAMKCGTTSLFRYLGQHPEVAPSTPKEPHFFTRQQDAGKGLDWYYQRWDWNPRTHRIALEASTSYTKVPHLPNAADRIARVKADFRFIYTLRDPLERIESSLAHQILRGDRANGETAQGRIHPQSVATSKYAMQIAAYYARFPADRILLLDFTELKTDPAALLKRVCRFLEIDTSFTFKGLGTVYNVSRQDHPFYVALSHNPIVRAAARFVSTRVKQNLRNRLARKLRVPTTLSEEQRRFVMRELADDMKRLHDEYGFDTSRWCHPTPE